ncbi:MAG: hypothetical protein AAB759_03035 [Patescibacteria group bacterium]|mgnify:FL=1
MKTKKQKKAATLLFKEAVAIVEHVASLTMFRYSDAKSDNSVAIVVLDAEGEVLVSSAYGRGAKGFISAAERQARIALIAETTSDRHAFSGEALAWGKKLVGAIGIAGHGENDHRLAKEARLHFYNMRTGHRHRPKGGA